MFISVHVTRNKHKWWFSGIVLVDQSEEVEMAAKPSIQATTKTSS